MTARRGSDRFNEENVRTVPPSSHHAQLLPLQHPLHVRLRARRTAAGRRVHQVEHQREPLPAFARRGRGRQRGTAARTAKISRPAGRGLSPPRGRTARRAARVDPGRQRQRRHPHDRHAGLGRRRSTAAAAVSQLYPLPHAGRVARCAERGDPLPARLVAAGGVCPGQRRSAAGLPGQSQQPLRHRRSARGRAGTGPTAALPVAGRRGLRRLRRNELPGPRGARTRRSWSRGR